MNENIKWVAAAVAVVGLAIGAVVFRDKWWRDRNAPAKEPAALALPAPDPAAAEEPGIQHPLPEVAAPEPLPPLNESDAPVQQALAGLAGKEFVERYVIPTNLVRHIVVSIDNLPNQKVAERLRPMKRPDGDFAVSGTEEALVLDPANFKRYAPLVDVLKSLDTATLVAAYVRYYPLFQEAYESLGHPPDYFNDRMIEVIDHLLGTPEVPGPIALTQPGVLYQYSDSRLESRSAGQKVLIRMGTENAAAVKAKLRELRAELVNQRPKEPAAAPAKNPTPPAEAPGG